MVKSEESRRGIMLETPTMEKRSHLVFIGDPIIVTRSGEKKETTPEREDQLT